MKTREKIEARIAIINTMIKSLQYDAGNNARNLDCYNAEKYALTWVLTTDNM